MATVVRWRRGTTAENDAFTGAEGEITVDMDKKNLRVHDNATQGGHPSLTEEAAHEAGYARQVDSVSDLRSGSFPASLKRLWLAGYYGVGTAGGGPLYRDSDDTTTEDNGGTVFVDGDGVRWKRQVSNHVDVTQFGAVGDGSNDDTLSIQNAIDAYAGTDIRGMAQGATIHLPKGRYRTSAPLVVKRNVTLLGDGGTTSVINPFSNDHDVIQTSDQECSVVGVCARGGDIGINMLSSTRTCIIDSCYALFNRVGIKSTEGYINTVKDSKIINNACGMVILGQSYQFNVTSCVIDNNFRVDSLGKGGCGVFIYGSSGVSFKDCTVEGNRNVNLNDTHGVGIYIKGYNQRTSIDTCWFEANGLDFGAHVMLEGGATSLSQEMVDNALPAEHDGEIDNGVSGGVDCTGCFWYMNTQYGFIENGARGGGSSITQITGGSVVPTSRTGAVVFSFTNSGMAHVTDVTEVSTAGIARLDNIRNGIGGTIVHATEGVLNLGQVYLNRKDVTVREFTVSEAEEKLGVQWDVKALFPTSGSARFFETVYTNGRGPGVLTDDFNAVHVEFENYPVTAPDYIVVFSATKGASIIRDYSDDGSASAEVHVDDTDVHRVFDMAGYDSSGIRFGLGLFFGVASITQATYDAELAGINRVRLVDASVYEKPEKRASAKTDSRYRNEVGDTVYNVSPVAGGNIGWVCTTEGSPGTWKEFGSIIA